jgi:hypothetical protein
MTKEWRVKSSIAKAMRSMDNEPSIFVWTLCECGQPLILPEGSAITDIEGYRDCGMRGRTTRYVHKVKLYTHELENQESATILQPSTKKGDSANG